MLVVTPNAFSVLASKVENTLYLLRSLCPNVEFALYVRPHELRSEPGKLLAVASLTQALLENAPLIAGKPDLRFVFFVGGDVVFDIMQRLDKVGRFKYYVAPLIKIYPIWRPGFYIATEPIGEIVMGIKGVLFPEARQRIRRKLVQKLGLNISSRDLTYVTVESRNLGELQVLEPAQIHTASEQVQKLFLHEFLSLLKERDREVLELLTRIAESVRKNLFEIWNRLASR